MSQNLLATLTTKQIDIAAESSYAYWLATLSDQPPKEAEREKMALREMRRHLIKSTYEKAVPLVQETVKLRSERRIDLVRSCFMSNIEYDSEDDQKLAEQIRAMIDEDIKKQICVVRGHDKENLAILTIFARTVKGDNEDAFLYLILYAMERATAITEFLSMGINEKLMVVLDFGSFKASLAPPGTKGVALVLQHNYPERLRRLVILDPPLWMRTLYGIISPFLDPVTKKKFQVCSGERQKRKVMAEFVEPEQAMPFMIAGGNLVGDVKVDHFTQQVPFHLLYDDGPFNNGDSAKKQC